MNQRFEPTCIVHSENGRVGVLWMADNGFTLPRPPTPLQSPYNPYKEVKELRRKVRELESKLSEAEKPLYTTRKHKIL